MLRLSAIDAQGCGPDQTLSLFFLIPCGFTSACYLSNGSIQECKPASGASSHLQGIQLVKQLKRLDSQLKQDAEVALYLGQFDQAEALYRRMDRPDLAVDMRMRLGDWLAVSLLCIAMLQLPCPTRCCLAPLSG